MSRMRENDLEFELLKQGPEAIEYNVTRCIYADFFRELGEPELGAVLVCDQSNHIAEEIGSPDVEFKRTQMIMEGGCWCDIRWRILRWSVFLIIFLGQVAGYSFIKQRSPEAIMALWINVFAYSQGWQTQASL